VRSRDLNMTYYYSQLLFHKDTKDTARSSLRNVKKDHTSLGAVVRGSGAQVVFSSVLLVKGKGYERAS